MKHKDIELLTIGDSCIDQFMKLENDSASEEGPQICFYHGAKIPVESFETSIAGNAINVGIGTNRLGVTTAVYSELGDDMNADRIISELGNYGIITDHCIRNQGTLTDIHPIVVYKKERTIFIYHDKRNYSVKKWPVPKWLYYSSIGKDFGKFQTELVNYLRGNPSIGVAFNPGTYHLKEGLDAIRDFLSITHVLILNTEEAISLVGQDTLENLHPKLQELGPKVTIITDGGNGSSASDGTELVKVPIHENGLPIVDKTGAGDAYSAGVLAALIHKRPLKEALTWGSINSAGVITEVGAIKGSKTKEEIEEIIRSAYP